MNLVCYPCQKSSLGYDTWSSMMMISPIMGNEFAYIKVNPLKIAIFSAQSWFGGIFNNTFLLFALLTLVVQTEVFYIITLTSSCYCIFYFFCNLVFLGKNKFSLAVVAYSP